ncbi:MAG: flagellar filament capping protein FliD, partial [Myxococcota bacterium]
MSITVDGIISGIDTSGLIGELVDAYSRPRDLLQQDIADFGALQTGLSDLSSRLSDLSTSLETLQDISNLRQYSVTYPETDAFIADASGEALPGVYSIEVNALARSELEVSEGFDDTQSLGVIAEGTLSVTYGGVTTDITVDSSNSSLSELAASINRGVDGVSAYVLDTGQSSGRYQLVVQGEDTGASNTLSFDTSGLTGGAGTAPTFTEQTAASNADLTINGIAVTSETNTVNNSIQGLSLNLSGLTSGPVDVTVALDGEGVQDQVQTFVDAYNEVIDFVQTNSNASDEDAGIQAGIFNGDSGVRRIVSNLQSILTSQYGTGQPLDSLGLLGIESDQDGKLSIDSSTFQDVVTDDRSSLEEMFGSDSGFGQAMVDALDVYVDPIDGTLKDRDDSIDRTVESLEQQVVRWEDRITSYEERLRRGFNAFEGAAG